MRNPIPNDPLEGAAWIRWLMILLAVVVMLLLVVLPLVMVLAAAFGKGFGVWWAALAQPDARAAVKLTLLTAAIVIPLNAVFGLLSAWALTRFEFRGKRLLLALIDLPFAVSPVVAGLCLCCCSDRRAGSASGSWRTTLRSCLHGRRSCLRRCSSPFRSSCANSSR